MDDIKDPEGKDPLFDTSTPRPQDEHKEITPESERRGGHESVPEDE